MILEVIEGIDRVWEVSRRCWIRINSCLRSETWGTQIQGPGLKPFRSEATIRGVKTPRSLRRAKEEADSSAALRNDKQVNANRRSFDSLRSLRMTNKSNSRFLRYAAE